MVSRALETRRKHDRLVRTELWTLAIVTMILAIGALLVVIWSPKALWVALAIGLMAVAARMSFVQVRDTAHQRAEASSAVANTGLVLATVAVIPLIAFAVLWTGLLLLLGAMWLLSALGVI